ncbi:MAG TPA: hypothetical protein VEZ88_13280 [Steroidobacteraceae bacterium]|nr:hypothetical protein [Steroidobacteraceae bacterium]
MPRAAIKRTLDALDRRSRLLATCFAATLCLLVSSPRSSAIDALALGIGDVQGDGWNAHDVTVAFELAGDGKTVLRLHAARLTMFPELGAISEVDIECPNPVVKEPEFSCAQAKVKGQFGRLGRQQFTAKAAYDSSRGTLAFSTSALKVAGGAARLSGRWLDSGWQVEVRNENARLAELRKIAAPWFELPKDLTVDGRTTMTLRLTGGTNLSAIDVAGKFTDVVANNAAGTIATDKLAFALEATLKPVGNDWDIRAKIASSSGQAYSDPIFLDFGQNAISATLTGKLLTASGLMRLAPLDVEQLGVVSGTINGELDLKGESMLRDLRIELRALQFPGAFASLIQPFLVATNFKDFTTSGRISGTVELDAGAPGALDLKLDGVSFEDKAGRLAMRGLNGRVAWLSSARRGAAGRDAPNSHLEWQGAAVYGITGSAAQVDFATSGADFRVLRPMRLPVLDGALDISTLSVRDLGAPEMSLRIAADLQPISVPLLCRAFGWPEFSGKVEGRIPEVSLEEDMLSVGGDLQMSAFGGDILVNGLKLKSPLGLYPRLNANVTARGLDLQAVTGTFEFGEITGRLNADIRGLELFRWAPIKFDARLYTPQGDKSRHLISQRAVKNLSNIGGSGGSVTAALQSGLLRFFENFRYSRLGLSCRLENETCFMDGVEPQQGDAYYIVKGSGIPRIDIIGNAHRVNWNRLLSQLKAIQESGGPVVK